MIRLVRNDATMVKWIRNVRSTDKSSAEELRTRLKLNSTKQCLQDRGLQWLGHLERIEENAWSSKYTTFKVSGSFL